MHNTGCCVQLRNAWYIPEKPPSIYIMCALVRFTPDQASQLLSRMLDELSLVRVLVMAT
eukprot:m.182465 g.182465  ORF g.182465 m.182465 type:complete len:59 (+) comp14669_c0_seq1:4058-4234(+)